MIIWSTLLKYHLNITPLLVSLTSRTYYTVYSYLIIFHADDYISSVDRLVVTVESGSSANATACATLYRHSGALANAAANGRILLECARGPVEAVRVVTLTVYPLAGRRARFLLCELVVFWRLSARHWLDTLSFASLICCTSLSKSVGAFVACALWLWFVHSRCSCHPFVIPELRTRRSSQFHSHFQVHEISFRRLSSPVLITQCTN